MRTYKRKSNRGAYTEQALQNAIRAIEEGTALKAAAHQFGVPPKTLRRHGDKKVLEPGSKCLGRKAVFTSSFELQLTEHIQSMERALFGLSTIDVRRLAYDLAERLGLNHCFNSERKMAGKDWFYNFLRRQGTLSVRTPQATSISRMVGFNRPKVDLFFRIYEDELHRLGENVDPTRLWNMDEVGVQNVQKPNKIVGSKGKRQVARVTSAERGFTVTAACSMNAAGQFVPPLFIFPRKRMNERLLCGAPAGSIGGVTDSGWMDSTLFLQWLRHFCDNIGCIPQRPHILILDGHHSHKTLEAVLLAKERGVIMITIPPHCSHKMQPLDRTFFKSFKAKYNTAADNWMTSHPGQRIDIYAVCGLFDKAYSASACVGRGQKGFKACGMWPVDKTVYKDEDFEGAEVTEEPDPTLEDSREIEEEISAGKQLQLLLL